VPLTAAALNGMLQASKEMYRISSLPPADSSAEKAPAPSAALEGAN
jgi:hypothetical protein